MALSFQRRVNLDAQKQWTGLASGGDELVLKKLRAWGVITHHDLPTQEYMIRSPREVYFL